MVCFSHIIPNRKMKMITKKENGLGLSGGILGIVLASTSFIFSWFLAPFYVVGCIVSIVLSAIGLRKSNAEGAKKAFAITGLATSIPTLLWNLGWFFLLIAAAVSGS